MLFRLHPRIKHLLIKRFILTTLCASGLFVSSLSIAMASPPQAQNELEESKPTGVPHPFMWEVKGPQGQSAHLMGTMHVPDERWQGLPVDLIRILDEADEVYGELDMSQKGMMSAKLMQRAILTDGKTLEGVIGAPLFKKLDRFLLGRGQSAAMMGSFHPRFVEVMIGMLDLMPLLQSGKPVLDEWLIQRAAQAGKVTGGVETIEEQLDAIFGGTMAEAKEALDFTLDQLIENDRLGERPFEGLISVYFSGDERQVDDFIKGELKGAPHGLLSMMDRLLHKRNQVMAKRVTEKLTTAPQRKYIFAFGVAHLIGKGSVVHLLRERGYSVKRLFAPIH